MGDVSMMVASLLLLCSWGVISETDQGDEKNTDHPSIWDIVVANEKESSALKGKGKYGGGQDAESNIVGGDIVVYPDEPNPRRMVPSVQKSGRIANAELSPFLMVSWHRKVWMRREIPYFIKSGANRYRRVILEGMAGIRRNVDGCLKFRPKRPSDEWWLEFFYGDGCFSGIGRRYWTTGASPISIGKNCNWKEIVMHEVLHALGFPHEQSRADRDRYVKIYTKNIIPRFESNFEKSDLGDSFYFGTPYDYKSIMHYTKNAYSYGGRKTTIEKISDPGSEFSGDVMTKIDTTEVKKMYGCSRRSDGWSDWIDTPCLCMDELYEGKKYCTRSKVRICFGKRECRSTEPQEYGTQHKSKLCKASEEGKVVVSNKWSAWSAYSTCDSRCGWGFQERSRSKTSSETCTIDRQAKLCRRNRCPGVSLGSDSNFDSAKSSSRWSELRFTRRTSKSRGGYVSLAFGSKTGYLESSQFQGSKRKKCLMFHYMMIEKGCTLVAYLEYKTRRGKTVKKSLPFRKVGNQGGSWKRAAITVPAFKYKHKIVFKATVTPSKRHTISIDDIFVDRGKCPSGLNVCRDVKSSKYCRSRGEKGYCNSEKSSQKRWMFHRCCRTCQAERYRNKGKSMTCTNKHSWCTKWAKGGECEKNPDWMKETCCKSCSCK